MFLLSCYRVQTKMEEKKRPMNLQWNEIKHNILNNTHTRMNNRVCTILYMFTIQSLCSCSVSRVFFSISFSLHERISIYWLCLNAYIHYYVLCLLLCIYTLTCVFLPLQHFAFLAFKTVPEFWWSPLLLLNHRNNNKSNQKKYDEQFKHP